MNPPVVFFAFARPDHTQRALNALRLNEGVGEILAYCDGPRSHADTPAVEEVRRVIKAVDWCDVKLVERDENLGLALNVIGAIDQTLRDHPAAVFLEDDVLPAPSWYKSMIALLERYRDESQVFSVAAYPAIAANALPDYPYDVIMSARFNCWGWGTWADRWRGIREDVEPFHPPYRKPLQVPLTAGYDVPFMCETVARDPKKTWACRVAVLTLKRNMLHAQTRNYLVENIGVAGGIHGRPDLESDYRQRETAINDAAPKHFPPAELRDDVTAAVRQFVADCYRAIHHSEPPDSRPSFFTRVCDAVQRRMAPQRKGS